MKQLLLSAVLLLFSISIFAQATPVGELRVVDGTTQFISAIPAGTKIFNMATKKYWVSVNGASVGVSLDSPGTATFVLINPNEQTISAVTGSIKLTKTASDGTVAATSDIAITAGGINAISTPTAGEIKITATEVQVLDYAQNSAKGTVTISGGTSSNDDVILPLADNTYAGLLRPEDFIKLSKITTADVIGTYSVKQMAVDATFLAVGADQGKVTLPSVYIGSPATSILVSYNGAELNYSSGVYSVSTATVTGTVIFDLTKISASLNDLITVSYIANK